MEGTNRTPMQPWTLRALALGEGRMVREDGWRQVHRFSR